MSSSSLKRDVDSRMKNLSNGAKQTKLDKEPPANGANLNEKMIYNTYVLSKHDDTYKLETFKRNIMIIFAHKDFTRWENIDTTEADVERLIATFKPKGFDIEPVLWDKEKNEIDDKLDKFFDPKNDYSHVGCVAIAVLSYGGGNKLCASDKKFDPYYHRDDIVEYMKCKRNLSLLTKPKLLIIQTAEPILRKSENERYIEDTIYDYSYVLPSESDIFVLQNAYCGKFSCFEKGSWFISTMCETIDECSSEHHLDSIATIITNKVMRNKAITNARNKRSGNPQILSTLIRDLYLKPYNKEPMTVLPSFPPPEKYKCRCIETNYKYFKALLQKKKNVDPTNESLPALVDEAIRLDDSLASVEEVGLMKREFFKKVRTYLNDNSKPCESCDVMAYAFIVY